ncbi:hypothetical protein Rhal01_01314 [Rubritalea halochordaticola]|uniref:Ice-binding protein C-terminal domain-containing protein n=1 Tax=Rubritalea halochordaticola TaxID=714537 RepID=A0ABP9V3C5_9BACT
MKTPIPLLYLILSGSLPAATTFLATNNTDFNDASNWSNGLPGADNPGTSEADGTLSANFSNGGQQTGDESFTIHSNINTSTFTFAMGGSGDRLLIGHTTTGSLTVNNGGALTAIGASQDVRIGFAGGTGSLIFENGSSIDTRKSMIVTRGLLSFGSDVTTLQNGIQNNLLIAGEGTLAFQIDGAMNYHTIVGSTVTLDMATNSTLELDFAAAPTTGTVLNLVNDVESFVGTFTNVNATGLAQGQSIQLIYNTTDGLLQAEVVPEPGTAGLLGLAGIVLIFRKRRG